MFQTTNQDVSENDEHVDFAHNHMNVFAMKIMINPKTSLIIEIQMWYAYSPFETNPSEQPYWSATVSTLTNSHQYELLLILCPQIALILQMMTPKITTKSWVYQWIGFLGKILTGNHVFFFPSNMGLSCKKNPINQSHEFAFQVHPVIFHIFRSNGPGLASSASWTSFSSSGDLPNPSLFVSSALDSSRSMGVSQLVMGGSPLWLDALGRSHRINGWF